MCPFLKSTASAVAAATLAAVFLSGCGGGSVGGINSVAAPVSTDLPIPGTVLEAAHGMYDRLNEVRGAMGLPLLKWNTALGAAAQSHADYMVTNQTIAHGEDPACPGFVGTSVATRVAAFRYGGQLVQETIIGGYSKTNADGRARMETMLLALLHRIQILALEFDEAGTGISAAGGPLGMNLGSSKGTAPAVRQWVLYPFVGQSDVTGNFYPGTELGLPETLPFTTGTPLTLSASLFSRMSYSQVRLVEQPGGANVELLPVVAPGVSASSLIFFPKAALKAGSDYLWTITATVDGLTQTASANFRTSGIVKPASEHPELGQVGQVFPAATVDGASGTCATQGSNNGVGGTGEGTAQ